MSVVIFTGPTISPAEARTVLDAEYLPPAAEGDVYRSARTRPQVIGIIDGYFERVPSVWHKEILWAMSQGIHVFGSASMGALRAAELATFGMEGVGSVFEAFRDGTLEDDDEVAVVHSADSGFRPGSEAMVDIRCTLARAVAAGVVSASTGAAVESLAKSLFYPDRNYALIATRAAELGLPKQELRSFLEWLPEGRASQKHADAVAMLGVIRDRVANGLEPKRVAYTFENSSMWEQAWRLAGEFYRGGGGETETILLDSVLEELRLEGEPFVHAQQAAILRCLAINQSYVQGLAEVDGQAPYASSRPWRRNGIADADAREEWMRANNVDEALLSALEADEARVRWITSLAALEANGYFLDQLRVSGQYPRLVERARAKNALLRSLQMTNPTLPDTELNRNELLEWYFQEQLGRPVPADLEAYARSLGFGNREAFDQSVVREYLFVRAQRVTMARGV